jgi:hypothetical protein
MGVGVPTNVSKRTRFDLNMTISIGCWDAQLGEFGKLEGLAMANYVLFQNSIDD